MTWDQLVAIVITLLLLTLAAIFSGLNLGMMTLDPADLKRKADLGNKDAKRIYPVRRRGNYLLVTLLIGNVIVISTMSVFLEHFTSGVIAVMISTALVVVFGEILPQAIFSRHPIKLSADVIWAVELFMILLFPIAYPLAYLIDKLLGEELPSIYTKQELIQILSEHEASETPSLNADEERIARGALTFGSKTIEQVMTPRSFVVAYAAADVLTPALLAKIKRTGYSRFPVYGESLDDVRGMLYAHNLLNLGKSKTTVGDVTDRKVYVVSEGKNLDAVLNAFLKTKHHLFVVVNDFHELTGVVSIEDVLEEILGREIVDEFDLYDNVRRAAKRLRRIKEAGSQGP